MPEDTRFPVGYIIVIVFTLVALSSVIQSSTGEDDAILPNNNHTIGVIIDYEGNRQRNTFIAESAITEINQYCVDQGYAHRFKADIRAVDGQATSALETVQYFDSEGVNLIVGPPWSSMFCVVRSYANDNGILVMSGESNSPLLAVDDNGFRLTIHDGKTGQIFNELLLDRGIEAAVCLKRRDAWADCIWVEILNKYDGESHNIEYLSETTSFYDYLPAVSQSLRDYIGKYGKDKVALILLSFDELQYIIDQSSDYPVTRSVTWYIPEDIIENTNFTDNRKQIAAEVNLTSFHTTISSNTKFDEIKQEYRNRFNEEIGFYDANVYDACWIYALSVINANTSDAEVLKPLISVIAGEYVGLTGRCTLDQYGDRTTATYDIYNYKMVDGESQFIKTDELDLNFTVAIYREGVH
ncbi:MAG: hypothetical protein V1710_04380 [Candidatus Bathyarchaeota archaeon]